MQAQAHTLLDHVFDHEAALADRVYLTQPVGGGATLDYTWGRVVHEARCMAAHLRAQGIAPGDRIAMLAKNSAHFVIAELAIWMAGGTTVAIFPTETAEVIRYVLDHSGASLLFIGKLDTWDRQRGAIPATLPCIGLPLTPATDLPHWDDIVARTPPLEGRPTRAPEDLAMLLYTSGSTGRPKGVMSSFRALTAAAEGVAEDVRSRLPAGMDTRALSYLPLAHSFERTWIEAGSLVDGRTRVYFTESLETFLDDLRRARPTFFISVPRLWLKFQQGVLSKMPARKLERLLRLPLLGRLVARKVRRGLGLDAVVVAGSGSAPMPAELVNWYRHIGLNLHEGYGMSEDNSYSHGSNDQHHAAGCVGVPLPGVQVRLAPDGEVLVKSPGQFSGYYQDPAQTAESFTEDGFFRTGDLGELTPDGLLRLTGRAKELFKTAKGKYVAPAPIENDINAHAMIEMSMVSGVGQPAAYALVVLAEDLRPHQDEPATRARVEAELGALLARVNASRSDYERLQMIVVARGPWTIEDGTLTPTMKIRRRPIEALAAPAVAGWYESKRPVVWA